MAAAVGVTATGCTNNGDDADATTASPATESASPSPTPTPTPTDPYEGQPWSLDEPIYPNQRKVALYGSPGVPVLGILGEQELSATIDLVQQYADDHAPFSDVPVHPAFEIITTVASAYPGADGNYTNHIDRDRLEDWVAGAHDAGIQVILDLQPGFQDFLTQAKMYEDLLSEPHVGLAIDPEWRLRPGQMHMQDIGQVDGEEVNAVTAWLADLVESKNLPEKTFIVHQFRLAMVERRELIKPRKGLALVMHADGHGTQPQKQDTWDILRRDLPDFWWPAWKNFIDEDRPMLTPEQTFEVEPNPWFISYQ